MCVLTVHCRFDKNMPGAASLDAFDSEFMEAHVLQEQLKRAFMMKVIFNVSCCK